MFTGIVEAEGRVRSCHPTDQGARVIIDAGVLDLSDVRIGDSIAVDGCCLTVVALDPGCFAMDVSHETLGCTAGFEPGRAVNLEKALRLSDRLGGHLVSGHVDGVGVVTRFEPAGDSCLLEVRAPSELAKYVARKGSVTLNGVSLTVNRVDGQLFEVNLIPHTLAVTNLKALRPQAQVNLEIDLVARYVERLLSVLFLALCFWLPLCAAALGQQLPGVNLGASAPQRTDPVPTTPATEQDLKSKLNAAQTELDRVMDAGASLAAPGVPEDEITERRALLELVVRSLERQIDAQEELAIVQRQRAALAEKVKSWSGFGPGPHPLSLVDGLRESAQAAAEKAKAVEAKVALFTGQLEIWRSRVKDAESALRLAEERASGAVSDTDAARRAWTRDLGALRVRALGATFTNIRVHLDIAREELLERNKELEFARLQVAATAGSVAFTREDLDRILARLDQEKTALERGLAAAQAAASAQRAALAKAQAQLDAARSAAARPNETPEMAAQRRVRLERTIALARIQAENANLAYDVARGLVDGNATDHALWQHRFQLVNEKDEGKLRQTYEHIDELRKRLQPWKEFAEREAALERGQVREQEARAADAILSDERAAARAIADAHRERAAIYERVLRAIDRQEGSLDRWRAEFDEGRYARPFWAYAYDTWFTAARLARRIWDFELFTAEDTLEVDGRKITATRSVTVGKSIGAVILLVLGYVVVSWFVKRLERQLVARFKADPNVARIARRWLQVILVAVLFVLALDLVKIPLTVFAFLGGALAIAFGFGAQNLLKNLMSGIMLLIERPLKIGDLVQIGDIVGTVTNISIRSSTIRTADGIETLLPNSALVENNVTNWTYSSTQVRRSIKVGIAYGSDTRKVSDTLLAQADRHGQVLKNPAPRVIFEDFGADSLVFTLEYWIDYGKGADGRQIASDLRFMTEKALAEAGIAVPFPQRDVHLDGSGPLRVEVVSRPEVQVLPRQSRA